MKVKDKEKETFHAAYVSPELVVTVMAEDDVIRTSQGGEYISGSNGDGWDIFD